MLGFIAAGGMGEVYEAMDLELRERVALKAIRAELTADARAVDRFRGEIQLARRVSHPNVCRTFDVFRHRAGDREVVFLSMELLAGETLAQRIRRAGPLSPAEALPIVRQTAEALAVAHDAGVVHCDFKCSNVVLVPGPRGVRAVVTDFGLARASHAIEPPSLDGGTLAYMAPEQLAGGVVSPATDVYALGVVLYHVLTGRMPFATTEAGRRGSEAPGSSEHSAPTTDSPMASALTRLAEPPVSLRTIVPGLDPAWERAVLRCLERDPSRRFPSPREVVEALRPARGARRRAIGGALALLLVVALVVIVAGRGWRPGAATPAPAGRRSVAVLGFANLSGQPEAAWISTALSELLGAELAAGGRLRAIPGESVTRTKVELGIAAVPGLAPDTLARVGRNLGAELVVGGSYLATGGRLRIVVHVQSAASGETLVSVDDEGTASELLEIVGRTGERLRQALAGTHLTDVEQGALVASRPADAESARQLAEGLERLRALDLTGARERLEKAVELDPDHPVARSALAETWASLGYDERAREEAARAAALSDALPPEARLLVQARAAETARAWEDALRSYGELWATFPDSIDHGLRLAAAQTAAGRAADALDTVAALHGLAPEDPRVDLAEAQATHAASDYRRAQAVAARGAARAHERGARLLAARARYQEAWALRILGEPGPALRGAEEARRLFAELGDHGGVARTLLLSTTLWIAQGEPARARAACEEALAIERRIGDRLGTGGALGHLASLLRRAGDLRAARQRYEEALAIMREIGNPLEEAIALNNLGNVRREQGDLDGALEAFDASLAIKRRIGDKRGIGYSLNDRAAVLRRKGRHEAARAGYEEALALRREIGHRAGAADSLHGLGDVLRDTGDRAGARRAYEQALELHRLVGEPGREAETRRALGALDVDESRWTDAIAHAEAARDEFRAEARPDDAALAGVVLARALRGAGRTGDAERVLQEARSRAAVTERAELRQAVGVR